MKILIDNGHGKETAGKRSPDGSLREYKYCREIAKSVFDELKAQGYDVELVTPEDTDVSISKRVGRVNNICKKYGAKNCVLVSIHLDAKGNGESWYSARGFSARVSYNASTNSKKLAKIFTDTAKGMNLLGNRAIPKNGYWMQDLGMCRMSNCPAVLTESAFMTNKDEVKWLLSDEGRNALVKLHIESIKIYIRLTE